MYALPQTLSTLFFPTMHILHYLLRNNTTSSLSLPLAFCVAFLEDSISIGPKGVCCNKQYAQCNK